MKSALAGASGGGSAGAGGGRGGGAGGVALAALVEGVVPKAGKLLWEDASPPISWALARSTNPMHAPTVRTTARMKSRDLINQAVCVGISMAISHAA